MSIDKMRIAIISIYFGEEHGGAAVSTQLLVDKLVEKHDVFILTSTKKRVNGYNTIPLRFFNYFSSLILRMDIGLIDKILAREIEKKLRKIKADIIHIQEFEMMKPAIIAASKLNIPTVVTVRDHRFVCNLPCCEAKGFLNFKCNSKEYLKCLMQLSRKHLGFGFFGILLWPFMKNKTKTIRRCLKQADSVIAISDFVKNNLTMVGVDEKKINTIHNPAPKWEDKAKRCKENKIILFAPGRLEDYKGFHVLLKAMKNVVQKNKNVRLIITGSGSYEDELKRLTDRLNLNDHVEFTGNISFDNIKNLYFNSDIVVFPSIWPESFGRVSIEAMAAGKPVIASRIGGIPEVVSKDVGILVKPDDVDELTKAIIKLINSPSLRREMGEHGRKLVHKFNVDDYCKDVVRLYHQAVKI